MKKQDVAKRDAVEHVILTAVELVKARAEEQLASDQYSGDDLTEDWHRSALSAMLRAEDEFKAALEAWAKCP